MPRLDRFKQAQRSSTAGYDSALREIQSGRKRGHWIWYVLPQLRGLGSSRNAREFGIDGRDEAVEYPGDPELRARLEEIVRAIADHLRAGGSLGNLMGSEIDALKTVSSLTLFERVAERSGVEGAEFAREKTGRMVPFDVPWSAVQYLGILASAVGG